MSTAAPLVNPPQTPAPAHLLRRVLSFPVMLASLLVALATLTARDRFSDPDMWWHLKTGEVIWTSRTIPSTDLFSFTAIHHALIPHEWLAQLLIYGAWRLAGYSGLMLWLCFFTAALVVAGYALCSLYSGNSKTAFLGALVIWFFSTTGLSVRPQLIGYLFLVLELLFLHLGRTRSRMWFFALPPLFALWVNCHGSFFLGICVLALSLLCSSVSFRKGLLLSSPSDPGARRSLTLALLLSLAALFLNPGGLQQVLYPLNTLLHQPINIGHIDEWQPLQWTDSRGIALFAMLTCIFLLIILRRSDLLLHELLFVTLGTWFAISHVRMAFLFGILTAPVFSRLVSTSWETYDAQRDRPVPNAVLIALSALTAILAFPNPAHLARQVADSNPVKAVEFIETHHLSGPMLNSYVYGGYLIWALPSRPVFIDGRADLYEWAGVLGEFSQWSTLQSDPNDLLSKYKVNLCLLERGSPMVRVLLLLHGWKEVYADNTSVIFARSEA